MFDMPATFKMESFDNYVMTNAPIMMLRSDDGSPGANASEDPRVFEGYVQHHLSSAHCMIILGQALNKDGTPPRTIEFRSAAASALWKYATTIGGRDSFPIVCTGGDPVKTGTTEASIMRDALVQKGVAEKDIVLEELSATTMENAYFAADILVSDERLGKKAVVSKGSGVGNMNVVLITSEFHMPRALYCFDATYAHVFPKNKVLIDGEDCELRVKQWALPAKSGCPEETTLTEEDMGLGKNQRINEQTLAQRLSGEHFFITHEVIPNLAKHVKKGQVVIPPLSEERHEEAKKQIEDMGSCG